MIRLGCSRPSGSQGEEFGVRKSVAAYGFFAVSLVFVTFTMFAEAKAQPLDRSFSLQEFSPQFASPQDFVNSLLSGLSQPTDPPAISLPKVSKRKQALSEVEHLLRVQRRLSASA